MGGVRSLLGLQNIINSAPSDNSVSIMNAAMIRSHLFCRSLPSLLMRNQENRVQHFALGVMTHITKPEYEML